MDGEDVDGIFHFTAHGEVGEDRDGNLRGALQDIVDERPKEHALLAGGHFRAEAVVIERLAKALGATLGVAH